MNQLLTPMNNSSCWPPNVPLDVHVPPLTPMSGRCHWHRRLFSNLMADEAGQPDHVNGRNAG